MAKAGCDGCSDPDLRPQDVCWVCLDDEQAGEPLVRQCHCPRPVHAQCLARWQLHAAGSREETHCRFCEAQLPDWRSVLSPTCSLPGIRCLPTMSVTYDGQVHHIAVRSGPGGYEAFVKDIRAIFGITHECEMNLSFDCADPATGQLLKLNGAGAYNAAVHCAAVAAAKRAPLHTARMPPALPLSQQRQQQGSGSLLQDPSRDSLAGARPPAGLEMPAGQAVDSLAGHDAEMCEASEPEPTLSTLAAGLHGLQGLQQPCASLEVENARMQEHQALLELVTRLRDMMHSSSVLPHVPTRELEQILAMQLRLRSMVAPVLQC